MIARIPSEYSEVMSFEIPKFSLSSCPSCAHKLSKLSIFPSYGLGCYAAPACSFRWIGREPRQVISAGKRYQSARSDKPSQTARYSGPSPTAHKR